MARGDLARFIVDRICPHSRSYSHSCSYSIDRREVAALFADEPELTGAARFFRPFSSIYSFFASDNARFRHSLETAALPEAVTFHAFRPNRVGHVQPAISTR